MGLLPTDEGCEGSPSRASKALEGKFSFDPDKNVRLPEEEWISMPPEKAEAAKQAFDLLKRLR